MTAGALVARVDAAIAMSSGTDLDIAFAALADRTRRAVIRELVREPLRAGELAARVNMTPPALSRHLRVLREAGLIVEDGVQHDARVSLYKVDLQALVPVRHWLDEVEDHWREQLASFKEYAERMHASRRKAGAGAAESTAARAMRNASNPKDSPRRRGRPRRRSTS